MKSLQKVALSILIATIFSACDNNATSTNSTQNNIVEESSGSSIDTIITSSEQNVSESYQSWIDSGKKVETFTFNGTEIYTGSTPIMFEPILNNSSTSRSILHSSTRAITLPESFDLRDPNSDGNMTDTLISPVQNQGQCGSCWSFATYGALEGSYKGEIDTFNDYSEDNLKEHHGFTLDACSGGNILMSSNYLSRFQGAISESEDPYSSSAGSISPTNTISNKYIDNVYLYQARNSIGELDISFIKEILVDKQKPIYASMEVGFGTSGESGTSIYEDTTKSFYQANKETNTNHAIVIVGYDDDKVVQGQTGVFIIKNSWGTNVGDDGYYYVPYTDQTIAQGLIGIFEDIDDDTFKPDNVYSYDDYGLTGYGYTLNQTNNYVMNVFQSNQDEYITAINIGIWAQGRELEFEIHKVTNEDLPQWGDKSTQLEDTIQPTDEFSIGYHTIQLDTNLSISKDDKFAIIVNYKQSDITDARLPIEKYISGYSENAVAYAEESYLLFNDNWYDVSKEDDANFLIKVLTVNDNSANNTPIANANIDQNVSTSSTVTLDGSQSQDLDSDTLTYLWSFSSIPDSSMSVLSDATLVNPTFAADTEGVYVLSLIVNDGITSSLSDMVTIISKVPNSAPIANANIDQNVTLSDTVMLDGSLSSDVDSDTLTYLWDFESIPTSSMVTLSDSSIVNPTFTPDTNGTYILSLIVTDGTVNSISDTVSIIVNNANIIPKANAGSNQTVSTATIVTLDGSLSTDSDFGTLTYLWSLTNKPDTSEAMISDATLQKPTFTVDRDGTYTITLVVNDGEDNSLVDTVSVIATSIPVANAGVNQDVNTTAMVTLDGSLSSDANSDTLTYLWSFYSVPTSSNATLSDTTLVNPTFKADTYGEYILSLVVNDGENNSSLDMVTISSTINKNGIIYETVVSPFTDKIWLDKNLGATQVCTSLNDEDCFGDYYQWGRATDGHEGNTSNTTYTQASDVNTTETAFIIGNNYWLSIDSNGTTRSTNWSKTDGSSICPFGYRVPTSSELANEMELSSNPAIYNNGAFESFLKLPSSGYRSFNDGMIYEKSTRGSLWSVSTTNTIYSNVLGYGDTFSPFTYGIINRASGLNVRCIEDYSADME